MPYKYQQLIDTVNGCPSDDYTNRARLALRFVKSSPPTEEDFVPIYFQNPKRCLGDIALCAGLGLSFFDSEENARARYTNLAKTCRNIQKTLGGYLATGNLLSTDGTSDDCNTHGHFTFHPMATVVLPPKFSVITAL